MGNAHFVKKDFICFMRKWQRLNLQGRYISHFASILNFVATQRQYSFPKTIKAKRVEPLTLAPPAPQQRVPCTCWIPPSAGTTQLQSGTYPSDGLASPQHPSVLLQEKAKVWKGTVEVEWPHRARAHFAGTLHAEHKKAADISLWQKGVCLSTSSARKIINYSAHKGSSRKG